MKSSALKIESKQPAETILEAAFNRFSIYGYNKTTMAEIAEDAGMSAANIYRYYKNKEEIAAACAKNKMAEKTESLRKIVRNNKLSAQEKLYSYAHTLLQITLESFNENKKIDEICAEITNNRHDIIHNKIKQDRALLMEILSYGNATGEFDVDNVETTAIAINTCLIAFDVPMFMQLFSKEEFELKVEAVIQLIINGLKKR